MSSDLPDRASRDFLARCGVTLNNQQRGLFAQLYRHLRAVNEQVNLTRIDSEADFWTLHVADSLSVGLVRPDLLGTPCRLVDVGTGAGFPLLPLAAVNGQAMLVGLEPTGKKADFVTRMLAMLGLANGAVYALQAREAGRDATLGGTFEAVLLRAVAPAGAMLKEVRHLLSDRPGGEIINYKTPSAVADELPLARREADKFGFDIDTPPPFDLPAQTGSRQFLIFRRQG